MNITTNNLNQNFGVYPTAPIVQLYKRAMKENPHKARVLIDQISKVYGDKILVPLKRTPSIYEKSKSNKITEMVDLYVGRKKKATVSNLNKEGVSASAKLRYILKVLKQAETNENKRLFNNIIWLLWRTI